MSYLIIGLTILAVLLLFSFFNLYQQRQVILKQADKNQSEYEKQAKFVHEGLTLLEAVGLEASTPLEEANKNIQQLRKESSSQIQPMSDR